MAVTKVSVTVRLFKVLVMCVLAVTGATYMQNCNSNKTLDLNYCVESSGIYFNLAKGSTWNVSFTEGEGLQEREDFLKSLESSSCPFTLPMNSCGNDCCFCDLEIPLSQHPISKKSIIPSDLTCKANLKHPDNQCHSAPTCDSDNPVYMPFMSIYYHNLKRLNPIYNNPTQLSKDSFLEQLRRNMCKYGWRNYTSFNDISLRKNNLNVMSEEINETTPSPDISEELHGIKFSLFSDNEVDVVTIENAENRTFSFSNK